MNAKLTKSDQVVGDLRRQIQAGVYGTGQRLPSIRSLVARYGHSKNVVIGALERLVTSGEIEARHGSGHYVGTRPARPAQTAAPNPLDRALDTVWMMREQLNNDPQHLAIGHGIPPGEWLADNRLDRVQQRIARTSPGGLFQYGDPYGYRPLRELLERRLAALSIQAGTHQIVLTFGANQALDIIVRCLLRPGDVALVDEPGYYPLFGKLRLHGARVVGVPREADGPDIAAFEQLVQSTQAKVFFTQSVGQNPTGSDTSPAKAYRLLQIAEQHGITLVENDALADLKPQALTRLSSLDQLRRTVYVGSFTKSVAAALRVGFIAAEPGLAERLADVKMITHVSSSEIAERTVEAMLCSPNYPRLIGQLHQRVEHATSQAARILRGLGGQLFCTPSHTLYLWAQFDWAPDSLTLAKALLGERVALAPGTFFGVDAHQPSAWSRFNVGYVTDARFARSMLRHRPRKADGR